MQLLLRWLRVLLRRPKSSVLLLLSLVTPVAKLRRSVDEFEVDFLLRHRIGRVVQGFSQGDWPFLATGNGSLDDEEVFAHEPVTRECTQGGDKFLGWVGFSHGVIVWLPFVILHAFRHKVDLLVDLGTVVVAVLTDAGHGVAHAGRVPSTDTCNLTKTTMGLARQPRDSPTGDDSFHSAALGDCDGVDHLVLSEDISNRDLL